LARKHPCGSDRLAAFVDNDARRLLRRFSVDVDNDDIGSGRGEAEADVAAHAPPGSAATAGYERCPAAQIDLQLAGRCA